MSPRYQNGSYVLLLKGRLCHNSTRLKPKPGDTVVVKHWHYGTILKTVAHIDHDNNYWLCGENPNSISLEEIGPVHPEQLIGKVAYCFKTKDKRR